ncbi:MAG: DUF2088 domain-containing protein [Candidatus Omnitrophica bacterium]|nr:DUF2088 domain-containing protein [Candidatus Omnitrophota bacterium]
MCLLICTKHFVYSGKKKIVLPFKHPRSTFLYKKTASRAISSQSLKKRIQAFLNKHQNVLFNKKVCLVLPDHTRDFDSKLIMTLLFDSLKQYAKRIDCVVALGLHKKLNSEEKDKYGASVIVHPHTFRQHSLVQTVLLGATNGIPVCLNKHLFSCDIILTIGIVEPHLYAGFSGGIKCLSIGLAGRETILGTHAVSFLSQRNVVMGNVTTNPFQRFLWDAFALIDIPTYSFNIVKNHKKQIVFCSFDSPRQSFRKATAFAKGVFGYVVKKTI